MQTGCVWTVCVGGEDPATKRAEIEFGRTSSLERHVFLLEELWLLEKQRSWKNLQDLKKKSSFPFLIFSFVPVCHQPPVLPITQGEIIRENIWVI